MSASIDLPKTIVVVGGGGVGQAIARKFVAEGWNCLMASRTEAPMAEFAPSVAGGPGAFRYVVADASVPEQVERIAAQVEGMGGIGVLATCVGNSFLKPLPEVTLEEMQIMVRDNFQTVFVTNRAFIPSMVKRGCGCIFNISSRVATNGGGTKPTATYTATKSAVVGFSQALMKEYKKAGVSVSVICPGPIDTPMRRQGFPGVDSKRLIAAQDVADLLFYLSQRPSLMMELPVVPLALGY
jgi:NAD(P)-dependent dehydrogenase (short-subunit alcohol dehydrogenase family)